ncbi:hypothetical protein [Stieleria neptunia]|uniref:hypothetical protein n=1 Tax=Stieleria neptunia TaxID=2527979 RepID=UPI0011A6F4B1|nr:hypothetical protein [Stieleria neptunia]
MNTRKRAARIALTLPPTAMMVVGLLLALRFPPRNPVDFWPALAIALIGLGAIGLLVGLLASLWLRNRVSVSVAISALAIPAVAFAWFVNGKSGDWGTARVYGLIGFLAVLVFFGGSIDAVSRQRDDDA